MKLQVTFFDSGKHYKPISILLDVESMDYYKAHKAEVQKRALMNIAHYRHTTPDVLIKQGFTRLKVREYDREKIKQQQEQQHKINLIKYYERKRAEKKIKKFLKNT